MKFLLNLQMFADGGDGGAAGAGADGGTAQAAENTQATEIKAGDTLPTGQQASRQVAAAMNRQMKRNPELRKVYGQTPAESKGDQPAQQPAENAEAKSIEDRWAELKKGEFAEQYGRDVQAAIQDRFKNAKDSQAALDAMEPMLKVFRDRAGVETNEELMKLVMDDDSLYEEEASEAGMTVAAYREFKQMQQELSQAKAREQESIEQQMVRDHVAKLQQQAEEFKTQFPDFDLMTALKTDENFRKLTSPQVGLSVRDAYFAIHHDELAPQMMAYGMDRAKKQLGQTLQAQQKRPVEGAMRNQGAAQVAVDPRAFTKEERERIKKMAHLHGKVSLI
jgi:hypothetical protein